MHYINAVILEILFLFIHFPEQSEKNDRKMCKFDVVWNGVVLKNHNSMHLTCKMSVVEIFSVFCLIFIIIYRIFPYNKVLFRLNLDFKLYMNIEALLIGKFWCKRWNTWKKIQKKFLVNFLLKFLLIFCWSMTSKIISLLNIIL